MLVTVLRVASLIAFAGPILRTGAVGDRKRTRGTDRRRGNRTPVVAELRGLRAVLGLPGRVCWQRRRSRSTGAGAVRLPSRSSGGRSRCPVPGRARRSMELGADDRSRHRPRHDGSISPLRHPDLPGPVDARDGPGPRLQQLACRPGCVFRNCADVRVARVCGGEIAD